MQSESGEGDNGGGELKARVVQQVEGRKRARKDSNHNPSQSLLSTGVKHSGRVLRTIPTNIEKLIVREQSQTVIPGQQSASQSGRLAEPLGSGPALVVSQPSAIVTRSKLSQSRRADEEVALQSKLVNTDMEEAKVGEEEEMNLEKMLDQNPREDEELDAAHHEDVD